MGCWQIFTDSACSIFQCPVRAVKKSVSFSLTHEKANISNVSTSEIAVMAAVMFRMQPKVLAILFLVITDSQIQTECTSSAAKAQDTNRFDR